MVSLKLELSVKLLRMRKQTKEQKRKKYPTSGWLLLRLTKYYQISERDEEALKYLKDVKWSKIGDAKGFKLEFFFEANPFFKNSIVTKTYHMINDDDEPILEKAAGKEIDWLPGNCLMQKILKKVPKKGSKNVKPITQRNLRICWNMTGKLGPVEDEDEDEDEGTAGSKNAKKYSGVKVLR